jgi:hypothetical protein
MSLRSGFFLRVIRLAAFRATGVFTPEILEYRSELTVFSEIA